MDNGNGLIKDGSLVVADTSITEYKNDGIICQDKIKECCISIFRLCFRVCMGLRLLPYQTKRMSVLSDFKPDVKKLDNTEKGNPPQSPYVKKLDNTEKGNLPQSP